MRRDGLPAALSRYLGVALFIHTGLSWAGSEGFGSTFYGYQAGAVVTDPDYSENTFIGMQAGAFTTSGANNTFVGWRAGVENVTGSNNTFVGWAAGIDSAGSNNSFFGYGSGGVNSSGYNNSFFGYLSGQNNSDGYSNTFIGEEAGQGNLSGSSNTYVGAEAGYNNYDGSSNTLVGQGAGYSNNSGYQNAFLGHNAGRNNQTGANNTLLGESTGRLTTTGSENTVVGQLAGYNNTTGSSNTIVGRSAGYLNSAGTHNVFIGYAAGYAETGSNRLYIDNCFNGNFCTAPLIYGEFDNSRLRLNGVTEVHANGAQKSQLNFSQSSTDTGGYLTSVLDNNFFTSSGARYDGTAGGWIQRSSDQHSVIQGSGSLGYRIFTGSGNAVGSNFTPTVRLQIDYSGQFGINHAPVSGHEIHTVTGAYEASGTWVNGSSRELKDRIAPLSSTAAEQALAALEPVTFVYKNEADQQRVGFIAEDVPDLVAMPDRKGLSPMDIVAVLTKVVQEQKQQLGEQSRQLAEQKQHVSLQEQRLQAERSSREDIEQRLQRLAAELELLRSGSTSR
jgi:hypothetical protein